MDFAKLLREDLEKTLDPKPLDDEDGPFLVEGCGEELAVAVMMAITCLIHQCDLDEKTADELRSVFMVMVSKTDLDMGKIFDLILQGASLPNEDKPAFMKKCLKGEAL